ncbi:hypothetical protein M0811_04139 [Anaeramoeba ignava]|uniref:Endonuclease/exonuclease/phosphatase domain-containing protein n=1 Tax=Anaeramoeba ignava TaxID=1746090 RepID=A0A9Q0RG89_ANAIG|nr:hypothetical protein M0811_04139 [Anaeramoeba ignava]
MLKKIQVISKLQKTKLPQKTIKLILRTTITRNITITRTKEREITSQKTSQKISQKTSQKIIKKKQIKEMETKKTKFRIATFNVLAPAYKRVYKKAFDGNTYKFREGLFPELWIPRTKNVIQFIKNSKSDIICLQECWLNKKSEPVILNEMGTDFIAVKKKRTKHKQDGLMTFIKKSKFDLIAYYFLEFNDGDERVITLCHLRSKQNGSEVIVANTHLTFPHGIYEKKLRLNQIKRSLSWINDYHFSAVYQKSSKQISTIITKINQKLKQFSIPKPTRYNYNSNYRHKTVGIKTKQINKFIDGIPIIFVGDFNGSYDSVYDSIFRFGFRSSFFECNKRDPLATHINHLREETNVDHIFFHNPQLDIYSIISHLVKNKSIIRDYFSNYSLKNLPFKKYRFKISPKFSSLLPQDLSDNEFPSVSKFSLSDHRPESLRLYND